MSTPEPVECSPDHHTEADDITIGDNQSADCVSFYQDDDVVHVCDWPAFKAAVDQHQLERGGKT